ncbi:MAG: hypothetical protein H6710_02430 [Myxococcales bacterium]|nr:hypothetical protein [Myxococcales bacterium]MCB9703925.1 hypothetical protein [Myxococcales bacterium]
MEEAAASPESDFDVEILLGEGALVLALEQALAAGLESGAGVVEVASIAALAHASLPYDRFVLRSITEVAVVEGMRHNLEVTLALALEGRPSLSGELSLHFAATPAAQGIRITFVRLAPLSVSALAGLLGLAEEVLAAVLRPLAAGLLGEPVLPIGPLASAGRRSVAVVPASEERGGALALLADFEARTEAASVQDAVQIAALAAEAPARGLVVALGPAGFAALAGLIDRELAASFAATMQAQGIQASEQRVHLGRSAARPEALLLELHWTWKVNKLSPKRGQGGDVGHKLAEVIDRIRRSGETIREIDLRIHLEPRLVGGRPRVDISPDGTITLQRQALGLGGDAKVGRSLVLDLWDALDVDHRLCGAIFPEWIAVASAAGGRHRGIALTYDALAWSAETLLLGATLAAEER